MTRYKDLWEKEQARTRKMSRDLKEAERLRDQYLAFIRDGRKDEFMWWLLDEMGIEIGVERPKCRYCGLEDGACMCAHLVSS